MDTFLYFAYGSNMLTSRLLARCRSAKTVGLATCLGHRLTFEKRSIDGSGKATMLGDLAHAVPGVLGATMRCATYLAKNRSKPPPLRLVQRSGACRCPGT